MEEGIRRPRPDAFLPIREGLAKVKLAAIAFAAGLSISSAGKAVDSLVQMIRDGWGTLDWGRILNPSRADDEGYLQRFLRAQRSSATPRSAAAQYDYILRLDFRHLLPLISVPTLVLHVEDSPLLPIAHGRFLAANIDGARLIELPGGDLTGFSETMADEVGEFLTGERPHAQIDRILTTVLFTDIVGSTERVASLGDQRWRSHLDAHDEVVRDRLRRFRGREINTTGDGFVASFDGPARAIRCARAIVDATGKFGTGLRAGLHTGECEVRGDDLGGLAVHIAARVGALAGSGEVLVSGTVKDLVAGSGIEFDDRGEHVLKGVPGTWKLFAVRGWPARKCPAVSKCAPGGTCPTRSPGSEGTRPVMTPRSDHGRPRRAGAGQRPRLGANGPRQSCVPRETWPGRCWEGDPDRLSSMGRGSGARLYPMGAPSGTVTFLFSDIEGSTRLWEAAPHAMRTALECHDGILRSAIEKREGFVFSTGGDGFSAAFSRARDALQAAVDAQGALASALWPEGAALRVRMGLHTGEVEERDGDYFGAEVNRAARLTAIAHGGQVLCSEVTASLAGGNTTLLDLGEHRLRDLSAPVQVFQVGTEPFPPLRSLGSFPTNLPAQSSAFVGREAQLAEVSSALTASRVVTLTGVGGVGKTRLAVQAAADLLPSYRDGAWLVELAPAVDPEALVEVVAGTLRVPERQGQSLSATVADFLRDKRLLVVLDNCEHLLDATASFVDGVVSHSPHVAVLSTSREGLGVAGERILVVPSLSVPEDDATPEFVEQADAVQLFLERAQEAKADFVLSGANAAAVARLVRRLDGIPLAIELAAARVRSLTPAELADRVDVRFRLLAGGKRTAVERHQTLRRAIDWSYALLTEPEQVVLNRAAVFAADFGIDAAEAILAGEGVETFDVVDLLGRLVDKSLMLAEDHEGITRYRLLETIRQYAQERLEAVGEAEVLRRRFAEHCVALAEIAGAGLRSSDEAVWTAGVQMELDHLRAALAWAIAGEEADLALRIVAPLAIHGTSVGYATATWAAPVVAMSEARTHPLYPQVLAWEGWCEIVAGEYERAEHTGQEALHAGVTLGVDERAMCRVFASSAPIAVYRGKREEVRRLAEHWVASARTTGDDWELAQALTFSQVPAADSGDNVAAAALSDEALAIAERLGNPTVLCYACLGAGMALQHLDPARALRFYSRGLESAESVDNQLGIAMILGNQAWTHLLRGEWHEAAGFAIRSLESFQRSGDRQNFNLWLSVAALILEALRDDAAAATLYGAVAWDAIHPATTQVDLFFEMLQASQQVLRRGLGDAQVDELFEQGKLMDLDALGTFAIERLDEDVPTGVEFR